MNNKYLVYSLVALAGLLIGFLFFTLRAEAWYQPPMCEDVTEEEVQEEVVEEEESSSGGSTPALSNSGGGGGMIWCSGPLAPGWQPSQYGIPTDGGCGGDYYVEKGTFGCPSWYPTFMGCMIKGTTTPASGTTPTVQVPKKAWTSPVYPKYYKG